MSDGVAEQRTVLEPTPNATAAIVPLQPSAEVLAPPSFVCVIGNPSSSETFSTVPFFFRCVLFFFLIRNRYNYIVSVSAFIIRRVT